VVAKHPPRRDDTNIQQYVAKHPSEMTRASEAAKYPPVGAITLSAAKHMPDRGD
jgi:hypothetical protein